MQENLNRGDLNTERQQGDEESNVRSGQESQLPRALPSVHRTQHVIVDQELFVRALIEAAVFNTSPNDKHSLIS